jgi:hypothetical protein
MKKLIVLGITAACMLLAPAALASSGGEFTWTAGVDQGSDNLPCTDGAHWVLTGTQNVTSATLTFKGQTYQMVQNGDGSFAVDTTGSVVAGDTVLVTYEGSGYPALRLSHCLSTSPSPSETESPSPSESESPSETESPSVSPTSSSKSPTVLGSSHTRGPSGSVGGTAFTGSDATPFAVGAGVLGLLGLSLLYIARRRSA